MVKEAKENEEADKKRKEEVDLRNEVDQLLFQTDKTLEEVKDKVDAAEIKKVEDARDALKKAQEANNLEEMKTKKDDLTKAIQDISVKLYEQAQQAQQQAGAQGAAGTQDAGNGSAGNDGNTVDGDFKEELRVKKELDSFRLFFIY